MAEDMREPRLVSMCMSRKAETRLQKNYENSHLRYH